MTRLLHIFWTGLFALSLTGHVTAQTSPAPEKKSAESKSETKPAPKESQTVEDDLDIDAMFKRGEEQAKEGPNCRKPDPIA